MFARETPIAETSKNLKEEILITLESDVNCHNLSTDRDFNCRGATLEFFKADKLSFSVSLHDATTATSQFAEVSDNAQVKFKLPDGKITLFPQQMNANFIAFLKNGRPPGFDCADFTHQLAYGPGPWEKAIPIYREQLLQTRENIVHEHDLSPGDIIFMFEYDKDNFKDYTNPHTAAYVGGKYYISLFGKRGPLIFATRDELFEGYKANTTILFKDKMDSKDILIFEKTAPEVPDPISPFRTIKKISDSLEKKAPGLQPTLLRSPIQALSYINTTDNLGKYAERAEKEVDANIQAIKKQLIARYPEAKNLPFKTLSGLPPELEALYQAKGILSVASAVHHGIDNVKTTLEKLYKKVAEPLRNAPNPAEIYYSCISKSAGALFKKIAPESTRALEQQSEFLIATATKTNPRLRGMPAEEFMQHPDVKNTLHQVKIDAKLTPLQTNLLAATVANQYRHEKSESRERGKLDHTQLKRHLNDLEQAVKRDISPHNTGKSHLLSELRQAVHTAQELMVKKPEPFVTKDKLVKWSQDISMLGGLITHIAAASGNRKFARQVNAISNGVSSACMGFAFIAAAHPVLGALSLVKSCFDIFSAFDDDDEENGLSILSEQIQDLHKDMMKSFNFLYQDMMQEFHILKVGMVRGFGLMMERFDVVDQNLYIIQNNLYKIQNILIKGLEQLSLQQTYIGQQLSHQLSETRRDILTSLQTVQTNIMGALQTIGNCMVGGFNQLTLQLNHGLEHLDHKMQLLQEKLQEKFSELKLRQEIYTQIILKEQHQQTRLLEQQALVLDENYRRSMQYSHDQTVKAREDLAKHKTELARAILQDEFPVSQVEQLTIARDVMYSDKTDENLSAGHCGFTSFNILHELGKSVDWPNTNPFDVINLLRRYANSYLFHDDQKEKCKSAFIHLPTWRENMRAYCKWLEYQNVTQHDLDYIMREADATLKLGQFVHELSLPHVIEAHLKRAGEAVRTLGESLEKELKHHQNQFQDDCKKRLQLIVAQQEIDYARLKHDETNVSIYFAAKRANSAELTISLIDTPETNHATPNTSLIYPDENETTNYALLLSDNKLPALPKKLLDLEAMGVGLIIYQYSYHKDKHELSIKCLFRYDQKDEKIVLAEYKIPVSSEKDILTAWQQFKSSTTPVTLTAEQQKDIDELYQFSIIELRKQLNAKLQQDLLATKMQQAIETVEAQSGLLTMQFKLCFETFLQDPEHIISETLNLVMTRQKLLNLITNFTGVEPHPFHILKDATSCYQACADRIITEIQAKKLYADNASLNRVLLWINKIVLSVLNEADKATYLTNLINSYPNLPVGYLLHGSLDDCSKILELQPDNNFIRVLRAQYYSDQKNWHAAIHDYTEALTQISNAIIGLKENNSEDDQELIKQLQLNYIALLVERGNAYMGGNYFALAHEDYNEACDCLPHHTDFLYKRALSFERINNQEGAYTDYQAILALEPDHELAQEGVARSLAVTDTTLAITHYLALTEKHPHNSHYFAQCIQLAKLEDVRMDTWLYAIANNIHASTSDLLLCGVKAAEIGDARGKHDEHLLKIIYQRVHEYVRTPLQYKQFAEIVSCLGYMDEWEVCNENAKNKPLSVVTQSIFAAKTESFSKEYTRLQLTRG